MRKGVPTVSCAINSMPSHRYPNNTNPTQLRTIQWHRSRPAIQVSMRLSCLGQTQTMPENLWSRTRCKKSCRSQLSLLAEWFPGHQSLRRHLRRPGRIDSYHQRHMPHICMEKGHQQTQIRPCSYDALHQCAAHLATYSSTAFGVPLASGPSITPVIAKHVGVESEHAASAAAVRYLPRQAKWTRSVKF